MTNIHFNTGNLQAKEQILISAGFAKDTKELSAHLYKKTRLNWLTYSSGDLNWGADS
jgi:hypothetical protein